METKPLKINLKVEGMSCTGCANTVNKLISDAGAKDVFVDFSTGDVQFFIRSKEEEVPFLKSIGPVLAKVGYKLITPRSGHDQDVSHSPGIEKKFYFCLIFTLPLLGHMFVTSGPLHDPLVQLFLCIPVYVTGFFHFGKSILRLLRTGLSDMDLLIFIGITSSFFYSLAGMIMNWGTPEMHNFMFYETSATITTLVLLGNLLEHKSVKQTSASIRELASAKPRMAKKIIGRGGQERIMEVETSDLVPGDVVTVNRGDRIPVDGAVISGKVSVDEAMITGESLPATKVSGDKIYTGSFVADGSVNIMTETAGEGTLLDRVIQLVENARQSKPTIQRWADRVSGVFVPVVLSISLFTFLISLLFVGLPVEKSLMNSIAVLVIACPCAMGLATPTAVMVGIGKAARQGIVFKGGEVIEQFSNVQTVVFDKTGTLTTGLFRIKEIIPNDGSSRSDLETILYNVEKYSSHPIARSIEKELRHLAPDMKFFDVSEEIGSGMTAKDENGYVYKIGSAEYAGYKGYLSDKSGRKIFISKNEKLAGILEIEDKISAQAKETVSQLKKNNIRTVLLSGDNEENCRIMAENLGIDTYFSNQKPEDKLKIIEELTKNSLTAMVGDGVNDAPSLARASIGISLGNATDIAIQNAGIILLSENNLFSLYRALEICKMTVRTIKQNLFWALAYNVVAIPVAAFGLLNPMVGALAMAFSDLVIIANSLRFKVTKIN